MPKEGIKIENLKDILRSTHENAKWSLCIGAGVSQPIFPDWFSLVKNMINISTVKKTDFQISLDKLKELSFSADAFIQALKNILELDEEQFIELMSHSMYANLQSKMSSLKWKSVCLALHTSNPSLYKDEIWKDFIEIRNLFFDRTTANSLAKVIIASLEREIAPVSILSFNAESLLLALINSYLREPFIGKVKKANDVPKVCDKIVDSTSQGYINHISYIHSLSWNYAYTRNKKNKINSVQ